MCLVVPLFFLAVLRVDVRTRRFNPTLTNEFNLTFELPNPPRPPARSLPFIVNVTESISDLPYYVYSNRSVLATNAEVLFDRPVNGIRQHRVYKSDQPEWRFQVTRTVTTHLFYRKFWSKPATGSIKIRERKEIWVSDLLVTKNLHPLEPENNEH
jgi:hypothetical protein